jgi:hypothetical protein
MKWLRTFLIIDGFIALLITAVLSMILYDRSPREIPKVVGGFFVILIIMFNIHFFGFWLRKVSKPGLSNLVKLVFGGILDCIATISYKGDPQSCTNGIC